MSLTKSPNQATASLLRAHFVMMKVRYHGEDGTYMAQTSLSPSFEPALPPITVTHSRRLFKDSMTQGVLICHTGNQPHFSISIVSSRRFGDESDPLDADEEESSLKLGSLTGFGTGVRQWSCGVTLAGLGTSLRAEAGLVFPELSAQASLAMQLSLAGPGWVATGTWGDEQAGVTTMIGLNAAGVELTLKYVSVLNFRVVS
jgi:DnaJ family protein C protein 11